MTNTLIANELDRLGRGVVPKPARLVVIGIYICCVVLDVVGLLGLEISPTTLARLACSIRPMSVISSPFFSEELLRYAAAQCTETAREPSISIIFLSIKLALGMLSVLVVCSFVAVRPQGLAALCNAFREHATNRAVYIHELKRWISRIGIVIALDIAGILLTSQRAVADFDTSLFHKVFLEDGLAVLMPATIFAALIFLIMFGTGRASVAHER